MSEYAKRLAAKPFSVRLWEDGRVEAQVRGEMFRTGDTARELVVSVVGTQADALKSPELFLAHERAWEFQQDGYKFTSRVIVADRWGNPIEVRKGLYATYQSQVDSPAAGDQARFENDLEEHLQAFKVSTLAELAAKIEKEGRPEDILNPTGWPRFLAYVLTTDKPGNRTTRLRRAARRMGPEPEANLHLISTDEIRRTSDYAVRIKTLRRHWALPTGQLLSSDMSVEADYHHEDPETKPEPASPADKARLTEIFEAVLPAKK